MTMYGAFFLGVTMYGGLPLVQWFSSCTLKTSMPDFIGKASVGLKA